MPCFLSSPDQSKACPVTDHSINDWIMLKKGTWDKTDATTIGELIVNGNVVPWWGLFLFCVSGCVQTIAIIGPVFGYLLGSLCAKIYVDIGYVDMGELTTPTEEPSSFLNVFRTFVSAHNFRNTKVNKLITGIWNAQCNV